MSAHATPRRWSPQQDDALKQVARWLKSKPGRNAPQVFRLFGFAGVGKTSLARYLAQDLNKVMFGAFTGKAAHVLRQKGCEGASTIHSMIYRLKTEDRRTGEPLFTLDRNADIRHADLVVIDEVSMVDKKLGEDLLSFDRPILVLGDPAQLPPIEGAGYFINAKPDVLLTEVHRQAKASPIIALATDIREGRTPSLCATGDARIIQRSSVRDTMLAEADQILTGLNATRHRINAQMRALAGHKTVRPATGERLVCLKNNASKGLLNGALFHVLDDKREDYARTSALTLASEDDPSGRKAVRVYVHDALWKGQENVLTQNEKRDLDQFAYGYALTAHKSQGSQWDNVFVFDEGGVFRDDAVRWRYTAITRAAKQLTYAID